MRRILLMGLVVTASLIVTARVSALEVPDLAQEAKVYAEKLLPQVSAPADKGVQDARMLLRAAEIMAAEKECSSAFSLYRKALQLGAPADHSNWLQLGRSAACANQAEPASLAAWLALQQAQDADTKAAALALLGEALERRSNWQRDWKPEALQAYGEVLQIVEVPWVRQRANALREAIEERGRLDITDTRAETQGTAPSLCLDFNVDMPAARELHYEDYIRFEPTLDAVFSVNGAAVCATGAAYGTSYRITVRSGLEAGGKRLRSDRQFTIDSGHREPALWFDGSTYVLQQQRRSGIPLYSVNTRKVQLTLLRINERNLLSSFVTDRFRAEIDGWEIDQVADTLGERVWEGEVTLEGEQDQTHTTALALPEGLVAQPGLYILTARDGGEEAYEWNARATQWLVVSDIGLSSYLGEGGLTMFARSLATGLPLAGVDLVLYARNNEPLGRGTTDTEGRLDFASGLLRGKGGREAVQVTALGKEHGFAFLQLNQPGFDLSDRGVSGRVAPGPLDAYLYTERGVYRPGESLNPVALLRDDRGAAVEGMPVTLRLLNPDREPVMERVLKPAAAGGYTTRIDISPTARTGRWGLELYVDPKGEAIGRTDFLVEAIVPPRIEADMHGEGVLLPGQEQVVSLTARYLFGAPAVERPVVSELFYEFDPRPFADYGDYWFGRADEKVEVTRVGLPDGTTDAEGRVQIPLTLEGMPAVGQPLRVKIHSEVSDVDGRAVAAQAILPVRQLSQYIGVEPLFKGGRSDAGAEARFRVVVLAPDGTPLPTASLQWRMIEEEWDYQWFQRDGSWGYQRVLKENPVGSGELVLTGQPGEIGIPVTRGDFRLELFAPTLPYATTLRFTAGDQVRGEVGVPDTVRLELDRPAYGPGDVARLHIDAPFAGEASLVIATNHVLSSSNFSLPNKQGEIEIPVAEGWGAGVYALVTLYRPGGSTEGPGRAVGVIWLAQESALHALELEVEVPDRVGPRQTIEVPVRVKGLTEGEPVALTLAAVDDGVLGLTDFKSPDPLGYLFGKRSLGTELRDLYGRLIADKEMKPLQLREGGGASGRRGAPPSHVEIVSRFSGIVIPDADGLARVPVALPDFNGRLRLMAVAWSPSRVGAVERPLLVSDPVVVSPTLPRFLALQDRGELSVLLQNLSGPVGMYRLMVEAEGAVAVQGDGMREVSLGVGEQSALRVPISGTALGEGRVRLRLEGPEGYLHSRELKLSVRGRFLPTIQRIYRRIAPGGEERVDQRLIDGLFPQTAEARITLSSTPGLDVLGLLDQLDRYPYGCLEQTTSRAMPLLYANQLAQRWGYPVDNALQFRIQAAIERVIERQLGDGSFGLWSRDDSGEPWLSGYAMDFLVRARKAGYRVPDYFYDKGLGWLREQVEAPGAADVQQLAVLAYAHYVLAETGQGRIEDARYLADTRAAEMPTPLAAAQLGAALAMQGEVERARRLFDQAVAMPRRQAIWTDYGSTLRDLAGVVALLEEGGYDFAGSGELMDRLLLQQQSKRYLSTQEQSWLILAARTLGSGKPMHYSIDGLPQGEATRPVEWVLDAEGLGKGMRIGNGGKEPLWLVERVEGTPQKAPPRVQERFSLERSWFDLDGNPLDLHRVRQGDRMLVMLEGAVSDREHHRALLVDLLPAGFEIENPRLSDAIGVEQLAWLPELTAARHIDVLDDRLVAAVDLAERHDDTRRGFRLAYLVRAVTPGEYTWPPAEVEDMYHPQFRANTGATNLSIEAGR